MLSAEKNIFNSTKEFKILNFYSDWCPPCHAFMPNFIEAEKTYWKYFDFVIVNVWKNMQLAQKYWVRGTPTVIILKKDEILFNKSWVPSWVELKTIMTELIWNNIETIEKIGIKKKKRFFGLF